MLSVFKKYIKQSQHSLFIEHTKHTKEVQLKDKAGDINSLLL